MTRRGGVLSFESFKTHKNNFCLYFIYNFYGDCYRKSEFYVRCENEKKAFRKIKKKLVKLCDYESPRYLFLCYQAYIIMRYYVDSDTKLFQ